MLEMSATFYPRATRLPSQAWKDGVAFEPYYADDTDGVQFQVCLHGAHVSAYVACKLLASCYGPADDCLAMFHQHREEIDSAALRRVKVEGPETVILRAKDLSRAA